MNKTYLSIIGSSTVGKSTLAHALLSYGDTEILKPVKQVTTRKIRVDDNKLLIKTLSTKEFGKSNFLVQHDKYGILWSDFLKFYEAVQSVGFSVNGPNEVSNLQKQYDFYSQAEHVSVNCINIMIRFSNDRQTHKEAVDSCIKTHFNKAAADERLMINEKLDDNFYFNRTFIKNHIDIVLSRDISLKEWICMIENKLNMSIMKENPSTNIWSRSL